LGYPVEGKGIDSTKGKWLGNPRKASFR